MFATPSSITGTKKEGRRKTTEESEEWDKGRKAEETEERNCPNKTRELLELSESQYYLPLEILDRCFESFGSSYKTIPLDNLN